jgi:hypothetical protein
MPATIDRLGGRGRAELTAAARDGDLVIPIADPFPLDQAAAAHDRVDADNRRRVLISPRSLTQLPAPDQEFDAGVAGC